MAKKCCSECAGKKEEVCNSSGCKFAKGAKRSYCRKKTTAKRKPKYTELPGARMAAQIKRNQENKKLHHLVRHAHKIV